MTAQTCGYYCLVFFFISHSNLGSRNQDLYHLAYPKDRKIIKAAVLCVYAVGLAQTILAMVDLYAASRNSFIRCIELLPGVSPLSNPDHFWLSIITSSIVGGWTSPDLTPSQLNRVFFSCNNCPVALCPSDICRHTKALGSHLDRKCEFWSISNTMIRLIGYG